MTPTYKWLPWSDLCMVPGESEYSLLNKLAWWSSKRPAEFVSELSWVSGSKPRIVKIEGFDREPWWAAEAVQFALPLIRGLPAHETLNSIRASWSEIPDCWKGRCLRICLDCAKQGVHLVLHQHLALDRCPVHNRSLTVTCPECGYKLNPGFYPKQPPFACSTCFRSYLVDDELKTVFSQDETESWQRSVREHETWIANNLGPITSTRRLLQNLDLSRDDLCLDGSTIMIELGAQAEPPPHGVRRVKFEGQLNLKKLNPEFGFVHGSGGSKDDLMRETPRIDFTSSEFCYIARRVGIGFIRAIRTSHAECLNTPIQSRSYPLYLYNYSRVENRCCPVAVGFTNWRRSVVKMLETSFPSYPGLTDKRQLWRLAFRDLRSNLHHCIHVSQKLWQLNSRQEFDFGDEVSRAMEASIWLTKGSEFSWGRDSGLIDRQVTFSSGKSIGLIDCLGAKPVEDLIEHFMGLRIAPKKVMCSDLDDWLSGGAREQPPWLRVKGERRIWDEVDLKGDAAPKFPVTPATRVPFIDFFEHCFSRSR